MTGEATSLFDLAEYQRRMGLTPEAAPSSPNETTVQRWCFVAELFHRVILPDPLGRAVAFQSKRTDSHRRIAFGVAAAFALVMALIWIRSWWNNGSLLGGVETAAQSSYAFQPNVRAVPSLETLKGLDALREQLETLLDYDRNGAPWRMRWGLYTGERVLAERLQSLLRALPPPVPGRNPGFSPWPRWSASRVRPAIRIRTTPPTTASKPTA